jgi:thiol:disulfide interchange protein
MNKRIFAALIAAIGYLTAPAQIINPVTWHFTYKNVDAEHVDLIFHATIKAPWHMYGLHIPDNGPIPTTIHFDGMRGFKLEGNPIQQPKPEIVDDKTFDMKLEMHSREVTYIQQIRKTGSDSLIITGNMEYQTCSDMQCVMGSKDFTFRLAGLQHAGSTDAVPAVSDSATPQNATNYDSSASAAAGDTLASGAPATTGKGPASKSLWGVLFLAMLAGLGGLLTPCVYPMIPMTVAYFLRNNQSRVRAITQALVFGLSIILIYTLIGVLVAIFKNPNAVNNFTTFWLTNLIFFLIFIILAASFFGMFEIILPSGLANKVDQQADKGGYVGAFFMALAMTILSFSCTGPIVASLLIKASQGNVLEPVVGMAGFSVIFALPFTLFAIFPTWLKSLPKSGGWLNGVKVFFAFIMLAFALYFLSKIDQTYNLHLLGRNLFLSIWIVIFALMGSYFLGWIRFAHDDEVHHVGFPRLLFAIASFSFALYLGTGLLGSSLKGLSTLLPPPEQKSAYTPVATGAADNTPTQSLCSVPSYAGFLSLPDNLQGYFDYNEALSCARQQNKPVLVDFVGHTCSNCKKMYSEVWSDPRVHALLSTRFILVCYLP